MKGIVLGQPREVAAFVAARLNASFSFDAQAIGLADEENRLIAGVLYEGFNGASIQMHVAAQPGARWMTRDYLSVCFRYPFLQLGVRKVIGLVGSANLVAQRFDEHLGFVLEATLKDAHPDGDLRVYTMTREQCRWLNIPLRSQHGQEVCTSAA